MSKIETNIELAKKAEEIAKNYKTLYIMGCFGAPMTANNKKRYTNNHSYNKKSSRKKMINAASSDTFGFDCVCLVKGILWGWAGNKNKIYGGATYISNGVPDINQESMITKCKDVTTNFKNIEIGEFLWMKGHCGIYIGDGLAVEATPAWKNCVQITAVGNIGKKSGYNTRTWTKHGKLPYITYVEEKKPATKPATSKSFFPKKGYFSLGDTHENIGKIASFMYKTFPAYTKKAALGNYYGKNIKASITEFQKRTGLEADGMFGPLTLKELKKYGFKG